MASNTISITPQQEGLQGDFCVPGDKSISHRVAILGGLAGGSTQVRNFLCSADCLNTLRAMQQLGARVSPEANPTCFTLTGVAQQPTPPAQQIDCGNSGTGMRLLAGVLAALPFASSLSGDESLCSRPMGRIITPLSAMGARLQACGAKPGCAPLHIEGGRLSPIDYELPMASAQVKSAVLLAGMLTQGTTSVRQPAITRDHTERLFSHFGIPCRVEDAGLRVSVEGPVTLRGRDITIPGDISSAAFWLVAAGIVPGSCLTLRHVGLNPTRTAIIDVLRRMGADISISQRVDACEPYGDITVRSAARLVGTELRPEEIPNLIDEIPILAVAAAFAEGETSIRHAAELRVKESDRIATTAGNLRAMGGCVQEYDDGMVISGGAPLQGAVLDSFGDHRIAMSFLVAGMRAAGPTTLLRCENISTSYPGFETHLHSLIHTA
ncbi:MAG: 3-phosphoshikimate 1-carboxyvinyltransferase [Akkermansiaceae bacterium]|nr:3-phosphoshikimate 1-carboxyvinyltransferase [Akkermansiaceae bacterium]